MFLGPLGPVQAPASTLRPAPQSPASPGRSGGRGVLLGPYIRLLNYLHIYYKGKKVSKGTRLARRIQCFGELLAGRGGLGDCAFPSGLF